MKYEWSDPQKPKEGISTYNHVILKSPLGEFIIEWKGWKDSPDYGIELDRKYLGTEYTLEDAKLFVHRYMGDMALKLSKFVSDYPDLLSK